MMGRTTRLGSNSSSSSSSLSITSSSTTTTTTTTTSSSSSSSSSKTALSPSTTTDYASSKLEQHPSPSQPVTTSAPPSDAATAPPDQLTPAQVERLGRLRPALFSTSFSELSFIAAIVLSLMMSEYFTSGFNIILPTVSSAVHIPESARTWPTAVPNLAAAAVLLPFSRLCAQYGARAIFFLGQIWLMAWAALAGLCASPTPLIVCRAMQGVGFGAFLPAGLSLLGHVYNRPGPRKNRVYCVYGAFVAVGFYFGIFSAGLTTHYAHDWRWFFFLGAALQFLSLAVSYAAIPPNLRDIEPEARMDWLGLVTSVPGLALVNFAFEDGNHGPYGWKTPYIIVSLLLGLLCLGLTVYVQGWVSKHPLMPRSIFRPKYSVRLFIALFCFYGVNSIFLFYSSLIIGNVLKAPPLLAAVWYTPLFVGGLLLAFVGGLVLHLLSNQILIILSSLGFIICALLFALMALESGEPTSRLYWAYIFPAMCLVTMGVDLSFNVTNVFLTTAVPKREQAVMGGLTNGLIYLGSSFFLCCSELLISSLQKVYGGRLTQAQQYQMGFWLGVGVGVLSLILTLTMRMGAATAGLTADEKEVLRLAAERDQLQADGAIILDHKEKVSYEQMS